MEESELYSLLESAGDAAFVVDQQGQILYWSCKAEDLLGFRNEQVVMKNCADALAGCDEAGAPVCCRDCRVLDMARKSGAAAAYDCVETVLAYFIEDCKPSSVGQLFTDDHDVQWRPCPKEPPRFGAVRRREHVSTARFELLQQFRS